MLHRTSSSQNWIQNPSISDRIKSIYSDVLDSELAPDGSPEYDFQRELEFDLDLDLPDLENDGYIDPGAILPLVTIAPADSKSAKNSPKGSS